MRAAALAGEVDAMVAAAGAKKTDVESFDEALADLIAVGHVL